MRKQIQAILLCVFIVSSLLTESRADTQYEIRELYVQRDNNWIYGVIYIPKNAGERMPTVVYSHGYGVTHRNGIQYAEGLAEKGYVVYCFDFCGGSTSSKSDGSPLQMSIFTQQTDLEAVIKKMQTLDYVDSANIFLFGASQGGVVSGITAAAHKDEIKGLILLYPGFEPMDEISKLFSNVDEIPQTYQLRWMTVGRAYFEKLLGYDIYGVIGAYGKDVLLIHGDADSLVKLSSSERALKVYPSAELKILPGAGHGLHGNDTKLAISYMTQYLNKRVGNRLTTDNLVTDMIKQLAK